MCLEMILFNMWISVTPLYCHKAAHFLSPQPGRNLNIPTPTVTNNQFHIHKPRGSANCQNDCKNYRRIKVGRCFENTTTY